MSGGGLTRAVFAASRPRAVAALVRSFRDIDFAEDMFQEACVRAAQKWAEEGVPRDPVAWLIRVARNAGLDQIRRRRFTASVGAEQVLDTLTFDDDREAEMAAAIDDAEFRDDVLRLMFMCCHPELSTADQLALALKVVVGFSVAEIARAFVVSPKAMEQRITRAKRRAAEVATRLDPPTRTERTVRLNAVVTMVYLLFNEGYSAGGGHDHIRLALCDEAIRLARLLLDLFPGQGEVAGLLALCLLQHSRRDARLDADGHLVALDRQDRGLWDREMIAEGLVLVEKALRKGRPGALQIQAAIAAVHCSATTAAATDWAEIERLYQALEAIQPSPVITLNRAVAVSRIKGARAALELIEPLADALRHYQPYHSTRAAFLEDCGDYAAASAAYDRALAMAPTEPERAFIAERVAALAKKIA
ncbi:RNA polymerase sigma factor [Bauldia sp.]|uniref:RNA polymerase sigma factor n=1 Tax=Bauldia sp. TaxID=2575872 RepID=UPI003BAB7989